MEKSDLAHLYRFADNLNGKLNVLVQYSSVPADGSTQVCSEGFLKSNWDEVEKELSQWDSAKLAEIATLGHGDCEEPSNRDRVAMVENGVSHRTSLYEMHLGPWLNKYSGGRSILISVAVTTVLAAMKDLVESHLEKLKSQNKGS